jgi:hypothetical protein
MTDYLDLMDSSRNFRSIRVIVYIINLHSIFIIDLKRGSKNFTSWTKRVVREICSMHAITCRVPCSTGLKVSRTDHWCTRATSDSRNPGYTRRTSILRRELQCLRGAHALLSSVRLNNVPKLFVDIAHAYRYNRLVDSDSESV